MTNIFTCIVGVRVGLLFRVGGSLFFGGYRWGDREGVQRGRRGKGGGVRGEGGGGGDIYRLCW